MEPQRVERRLAAVLAADVAGYSRLMGADEEGTLARLKSLRRELIDPKIDEHRGRIVKTTGDGALVEFPSVVEAVRCAVEVQQGMVGRNADVPKDRRIEIRIGVNLGDIIVDPDDIHGDGVNVAARLQQLAQPGGVAVSRTVVDHVKHKLALRFVSVGAQRLKNIAEPVEVYRVRLDPGGTATAPRRQWRAGLAAGAALLIAIGVAGTAYMKYGTSHDEPPSMPPSPKSEPPGATPPQETPPLDTQVWEAIRNSTNPADYEAYLRIFPSGPVADKARERLKQLAPARQPPASRARPVPAAPAPTEKPRELALRHLPPPVEAPQPPASTDAPTSTASTPAPRQQADVPAPTTAAAPAAAPQQQAMVAPDVSKSVTSPALPGAPYDGEWKGVVLGPPNCVLQFCRGNIKVTIAKNAASGKGESSSGNVQLSGTIAKDGSFAGKLGATPITGKFDEDRFQGVIAGSPGNAGGALFLERVK